VQRTFDLTEPDETYVGYNVRNRKRKVLRKSTALCKWAR
jgi:hypothetical protein